MIVQWEVHRQRYEEMLRVAERERMVNAMLAAQAEAAGQPSARRRLMAAVGRRLVLIGVWLQGSGSLQSIEG